MIADGDGAALPGRLPHAVELVPVADAAALRSAGAAGRARVQDVRAAVDVDRPLVRGVARVDGHRVERVVHDVPLDARIGRPAVDPDVRVAASRASSLLRVLGGDGAVLVVGLGVVPLQADAGQEVPRVVPRGAEGRRAVGRDRPAAAVRPDGPVQTCRRTRRVRRRVDHATARRAGVAIDVHRGAGATGGSRRAAAGRATRHPAGTLLPPPPIGVAPPRPPVPTVPPEAVIPPEPLAPPEPAITPPLPTLPPLPIGPLPPNAVAPPLAV